MTQSNRGSTPPTATPFQSCPITRTSVRVTSSNPIPLGPGFEYLWNPQMDRLVLNAAHQSLVREAIGEGFRFDGNTCSLSALIREAVHNQAIPIASRAMIFHIIRSAGYPELASRLETHWFPNRIVAHGARHLDVYSVFSDRFVAALRASGIDRRAVYLENRNSAGQLVQVRNPTTGNNVFMCWRIPANELTRMVGLLHESYARREWMVNGEMMAGSLLNRLSRLNATGYSLTPVAPDFATPTASRTETNRAQAVWAGGGDLDFAVIAAQVNQGPAATPQANGAALQAGTPSLSHAQLLEAVRGARPESSYMGAAREFALGATGEWWFLGTARLEHAIGTARIGTVVETYVPRAAPPRAQGNIQTYVALVRPVGTDNADGTLIHWSATGSFAAITGLIHAARMAAVQGGYKVSIGGNDPFAAARGPAPTPAPRPPTASMAELDGRTMDQLDRIFGFNVSDDVEGEERADEESEQAETNWLDVPTVDFGTPGADSAAPTAAKKARKKADPRNVAPKIEPRKKSSRDRRAVAEWVSQPLEDPSKKKVLPRLTRFEYLEPDPDWLIEERRRAENEKAERIQAIQASLETSELTPEQRLPPAKRSRPKIDMEPAPGDERLIEAVERAKRQRDEAERALASALSAPSALDTSVLARRKAAIDLDDAPGDDDLRRQNETKKVQAELAEKTVVTMLSQPSVSLIKPKRRGKKLDLETAPGDNSIEDKSIVDGVIGDERLN